MLVDDDILLKFLNKFILTSMLNIVTPHSDTILLNPSRVTSFHYVTFKVFLTYQLMCYLLVRFWLLF